MDSVLSHGHVALDENISLMNQLKLLHNHVLDMSVIIDGMCLGSPLIEKRTMGHAIIDYFPMTGMD